MAILLHAVEADDDKVCCTEATFGYHFGLLRWWSH